MIPQNSLTVRTKLEEEDINMKIQKYTHHLQIGKNMIIL